MQSRTAVDEARAVAEMTLECVDQRLTAPSVERSRLSVASRHPGSDVNRLSDDTSTDAPSGASVLFGGPAEVEAS